MLIESVNPSKQVMNKAPAQDPVVQGRTAQQPVPSRQGSGERKPDVALLKDVLEVSKSHFDVAGVVLDFSVHEGTGTVKVDVTDKETGEVIREVPPQKVLDLMAKLDEMMGIIYDEKA